MPRQLKLFFCALQFLTRLPVPSFVDFQSDWITRAARYYPLVGILVGAISAGVLLAGGQVWSGLLPALLAVAAGVLVTGGFHEDGLADTADGLGGGQAPARRLEIMKDSRVGTYGVLTHGRPGPGRRPWRRPGRRRRRDGAGPPCQRPRRRQVQARA
jgi:adenosylcobinamide-GDP ribazoletransferase